GGRVSGRRRRRPLAGATGRQARIDLLLGGGAAAVVAEPGADLQPATDEHDRGEAAKHDREPAVDAPRGIGPVSAAAGALADLRAGQLRDRRERRMLLAGPRPDRVLRL